VYPDPVKITDIHAVLADSRPLLLMYAGKPPLSSTAQIQDLKTNAISIRPCVTAQHPAYTVTFFFQPFSGLQRNSRLSTAGCTGHKKQTLLQSLSTQTRSLILP
jgi:hypothetical protein